MATAGDGSSNVRTGASKSSRRLQTGVRTLIVLVACCAAILWAWRSWLANTDPLRVEARAVRDRAIAALRSGDPAERRDAIVELARLHGQDDSLAIPPLSEVLGDPVAEVRLAAAEALESMAGSVASPQSGEGTIRVATMALARCMKDPEPAVRDAAVRALHAIGGKMARSRSGTEAIVAAVTVLRRSLSDPEPEVRLAAATCLGDLVSPQTARDSTAALLASLKDPETGVRCAAATSLEKLASPEFAAMTASQLDRRAAIAALAELLDDRDAKVRLAALRASVEHSVDPSRVQAKARITLIAPGQVLQHPSTDPPRMLAKALKDEFTENRVAAVRLIGSFNQGLDPWVPVLLGLAEHDPELSVREACFETLKSLKPPAVTAGVVPRLIPSL
jgi:HEAT repeat protein